MTSTSTLPAAALNAARAALTVAINDNAVEDPKDDSQDNLEDGEIQELDMAAHAEEIRTDILITMKQHPLYSTWTLWFDSPNTKNRNLPQTPSVATPFPATPATPVAAIGWMEDIKKVINFDSVEEFWGLYNNTIPPSKLPAKANYYLFKDDIIPAWEDDANKNGGKWSIQLPKDKNKKVIDTMWLYTMLAAIGETFDPILTQPHPPSGPAPEGLITGVVFSSRLQFYRISIWTRLAPQQEDDGLRQRIEAIGKHFKIQVLGFGEGQKLGGPLATEVEFMSHKDSEKKGKGKKIIV
ncbi:hypothetical protein Clacol_003044 [Clathrus columnatus]|uniref:Eukaryotic translation initiation factor 4E n=1 Tax=Clathrus columnatus TaxID=1419009 RepID=A0AAV5A780_9AGAM|nr:hypothetical protein Clacol_003044 [Clathrus columnatus]